MSDWNWYGDSEKKGTVVPRVDAIAVYQNGDGDIVLRQQDGMGEEDAVIVIPRVHAQAIIDAVAVQMQEE